MKLSTLLFATAFILQIKFSAEALTNYRFLNLTKHTNEASHGTDLTFDDDYYYYDDIGSLKTNSSSQYDYYDATKSTPTTTTTTTAAPLTTTTVDSYLYYDDYDNSDYYDYYDDYKVDPYTCPSKCKCVFNKIGKTLQKRADTDYAYEYTDDYNDKDKYKIEVDCSGASLTTVVGLFDELFPLDQIVKLNISNNKFRALRIAQVFEDIVNLEVLDVSSNPDLRSLSPRRFLKKFRRLNEIYLNNLAQINCNTAAPNQMIRIDCRWFKTLIYLDKRNLTVQVNSSPGTCDVNTLTSSILVMSKCLRSFNSKENRPHAIKPLNRNEIELKIEPELDQLLIEGDTLTLTCRFKKLPDNKKTLKQTHIFLKTKLNWFMLQKSSGKSLALKPTQMNSNDKFFVSIFQAIFKFEEEKIIESKLIIKRTNTGENSGKYFCSTENSNQMNLYNNLNTSHVDIQVVNKNSLTTPTVSHDDNESNSRSEFNKSAIYCPQHISQTYKGVISWPKTLSNTLAKEKCSVARPLSTGIATYRCTAEGMWSNTIDLSSCDFESNLTRSLQGLTYLSNKRTEIILNSDLTLDKLISSVVNMVDPFQINKFDILYIQRFLVAKLNVSREESLSSKSLRAQFVWLNDLLAKLSPIELNEARKLDFALFNVYFSRTFMPMLTHNFNDNEEKKSTKEVTKLNTNAIVSSYVATKTLGPSSPSTNTTICHLKKYTISQQVYIDCSPSPSTTLSTRISLQRVKRKTMLMVFENANVFGMFEANKTFTNLNTSNQLIDFSLKLDESSLGICSQVFGIVRSNKDQANHSSSLDVTLEIKMPANYYTLLKQIESKVINRNKEIQQEILSRTANLTVNTLKNFELVKRVEKLGDLVEEVINPFDKIFMSNGDVKASLVLAHRPLNYSNGDEISKLANDLSQIDLNDSAKIWELRESLVNKWYFPSNYEIAYSTLPLADPMPATNWSPKPNKQLNCSLANIEQVFKAHSTLFSNETSQANRQANTYKLFANLKCNTPSGNDSLQAHFLSLMHRETPMDKQINTEHSFQQVIQMIDEYARLFQLDIATTSNTSLYNKFKNIVATSYNFFSNRVIYFAGIISSCLLIASFITYVSLGECLQMPRSFRHIFANIWLAAFLLIVMFILGIKQIHIAHLCFATAIVMHYLLLCLSLWYMLYFYSLFAKLYTLKDRNFDLLFTNGKPKKAEYKSMPKSGSLDKNEPKNADDDDYDEEDENDYVQKPVIYLYMIGWGLPLLLCSVIVSITKRNYLTVPFAACFPNNQAILIGSLLLPVCILLLVKIVFISLITITLRRIVNDLKNDSDQVAKIENSDSLSDKLKLCQDWANKESPTSSNKVNTNSTDSKSSRNSNSSQPASITDQDSDLSNNYSDQTSVMDAQYKPSVQLKFAFCSYLFLGFICVLGGLLVNVHRFIGTSMTEGSNETEVYFLFNQTKLISQSDIRRLNLYEFYDKISSYSLSICLILYSLGQMSFYLLSRDDMTHLTSSFTATQTFNRMSYYFKFRFLRVNRPLKTLQTKIENTYSSSDNNIYSEPNEEASLRAHEPIKIDQIDYKSEQKQDLSPIMKADSIFYEENNNPKIDQDDSLAKSISDVLFSSSKKATPSTVSIKSSNTMSESSGSMSEMKPTLAAEESISDSQATESLKKINVDAVNTMESSEKVTDNIRVSGKKSHVRQSSILSGSAHQNVQVIYGGSVGNKILDMKNDKIINETNITSQYSSLNSRRNIRNSSTKSTTSKRPCYVYVDHSQTNEDKMKIHRLKKIVKTETTFTSSNSIPTSKLETTDLQYFQKGYKSTKIDDLLTKSCSNNTGVGAIGALGNFESSLGSQNTDETLTGTNTCSSESFMKFTNSNKSTECPVSADDSTTSSISSSIIMSNNNLINDLNNFRENLEFNDHVSNHYDEQTVYGQAFNVYSSSQISEKIYQSIGASRPQGKALNSVLRTNILRHGEADVKNETSV